MQMKNIFFYISITFLLASCHFDSKSTQTESKELIQPKHNSGRECFSSVMKRDSIWVRLEFSSHDVTGILIYDFNEKDQNHGTLQGTLKGDTLLATYNFHSEGKTSVREVAFLFNDDQLIEGFGEMDMKEDRQVFKERSNIDFSKGIEFQKIDCETYKLKFQ